VGVGLAKVSLYGGIYAQNVVLPRWRYLPDAGIQYVQFHPFQGGAVMNLPIQIINFALANAAHHATREDVAAGLIAALRSVRSVVSEREGFASLCALDDGIREHLLKARLRQHEPRAAESRPRSLPQESQSRTRQIATAMLRDAVTFIMTAVGPVPVGLIAGGVVHHLVRHLIECLGGPPDADELIKAIRDPEGIQWVATGSELPMVVRIH